MLVRASCRAATLVRQRMGCPPCHVEHIRHIASARQLATIEDALKTALSGVMHPLLQRPIGSKAIRAVSCTESSSTGGNAKAGLTVAASMQIFSPAAAYVEAFHEHCTTLAVETVKRERDRLELSSVGVAVNLKLVPQPHERDDMAAAGKGLANVGSVIAVSSGKGGVGKSTVAVNLAYALARRGARVGILDADIHGPSLPIMVQPSDVTVTKLASGLITPLVYKDVKLMSYGWVSPRTAGGNRSAAVMRGPLVSSILQQLLKFTDWGHLDHLVVDMPPGTGDIHITLGQSVPISTSVIVTTPQMLATVDVAKGMDMFKALNVQTCAIVLNMASFTAPDTGVVYYPFGDGKARVASDLARYGVKTVVELPIIPAVSLAGDSGVPVITHADCDERVRSAYDALAGIAAEAAEVHVMHKQGSGAASTTLGQPPRVSAQLDATKRAIRVRTFSESGASEICLPNFETRVACRCAACVDESTGKVLVDPSRIPPDVCVVSVEAQGNYGVAVTWSDGHSSSIYSFDQLSRMALPSGTLPP